jgi:hypothetical protein
LAEAKYDKPVNYKEAKETKQEINFNKEKHFKN